MEQSNPALPYKEIEINGQTLKMVFDYGALATAEDELYRKGYEASLLGAMLKRGRTFSSLRVLFAMSLYAYQPEIDPVQAQNWLTADNLLQVIAAVDRAWDTSVPDATPETDAEAGDPPKPSQQGEQIAGSDS